MNELPVWHIFPDTAALDRQLAETVAALLGAAIKHDGAAVLAVSGGKTPVGFFTQLSEQRIPWQKVSVTLVDERWVKISDDDNNEGLVRRYLLVGAAASARFVGLKNAAPTAALGRVECERTLRALGAPEVVVLGMGDDGHTASLFPDAVGLTAALDPEGEGLCAAITPSQARYERMTMTIAGLLRANHIMIHITGADKKALLERAQGANPMELPIAAVLNQDRVPVSVYWSDTGGSYE